MFLELPGYKNDQPPGKKVFLNLSSISHVRFSDDGTSAEVFAGETSIATVWEADLRFLTEALKTLRLQDHPELTEVESFRLKKHLEQQPPTER